MTPAPNWNVGVGAAAPKAKPALGASDVVAGFGVPKEKAGVAAAGGAAAGLPNENPAVGGPKLNPVPAGAAAGAPNVNPEFVVELALPNENLG